MSSEASYWDCLFQIMEYAVDGALEAPVTVDGRELTRLDLKRFVTELYRPWPGQGFEQRLIKELLSSVPLICIVAPKGSGKTSSLRYALYNIETQHPDVARVLIDVKKFFDAEAFARLTSATALPTFRAEIRRIVQQSLLPTLADTVAFTAWVLAGPSDTTDPFNSSLLAELQDEAMDAQMEFECGGADRMTRVNILTSALRKPANYSRYSKAIRDRIRTAHVVQSAVSLGRASRVLLVFDNVDRIPDEHQSNFLQAVNDSHNALAGACVTAVAIRKETLHSPRPNKHGDVITMVLPDGERYPCVLLPENRHDHVRDIFESRHKYSRQLLETLAPDVAAEDIATTLDLIHTSILTEFINDSVHALANGSIRTTVSIYTGFVRYLMALQEQGVAAMHDVISSDADHLQTLFFVWLRTKATDYGLLFYDVIKPDVDPRAAREFADLASEHHLLLTTILNLCEEQHTGSDPAVHDVFDRLTRVGFKDEQIGKALKSMSAPPHGSPGTIEFTDVTDEGDHDRNSSARVRLTPLGNVLISDLLDKVGYVWGKALDRAKLPPDKSRNYHSFNRFERMRIFLEYSRDLARHHLRLLSLLRREWGRIHGTGWLAHYRSQFGVHRKLQVERLLESAQAFYGPFFRDTNAFSALLNVYRDLQQRLVRGDAFADLPLERLDDITIAEQRDP